MKKGDLGWKFDDRKGRQKTEVVLLLSDRDGNKVAKVLFDGAVIESPVYKTEADADAFGPVGNREHRIRCFYEHLAGRPTTPNSYIEIDLVV